MSVLLGSKNLSVAVSEILFSLPNFNNVSTHLVLMYLIILDKLSKYNCNKKVPTSQSKDFKFSRENMARLYFTYILTEIGTLNKCAKQSSYS